MTQTEKLNPDSQVQSLDDSSRYRPYKLSFHDRQEDSLKSTECPLHHDWVSELELDTVKEITQRLEPNKLKFLVLYGSLRERYYPRQLPPDKRLMIRSYSRLMAYEAARILDHIGADVRVFDPQDLPMKDEAHVTHPKVVELRGLSAWSDGHFWVSPEQHGNLVFPSWHQLIPRLLSTKIRLTGYPFPPVLSDRLRAEHSQYVKSMVAVRVSTPSIPFAFLVVGCECLLSRISRPFQRRGLSLPPREGSCLLQTEKDW